MQEKELNFQNVLVIDFGQLGDVVLSLPALRAIRERFSDAKITLLMGKAAGEIVRLADVSDDRILVDRVALRDGNTARSILEILRLVRQVRHRKFDLVIDLHSLYETNLLGFLSGAKHRLFANRENRSFDRLSNFRPKPPAEDRTKHAAVRYLDAVRPLGIIDPEPYLDLKPDDADLSAVRQIFAEQNIAAKDLVGMFLGAGHPGRRWPLEKFAELAGRLADADDVRVVVFLGPEERDIADEVHRSFPAAAIILDKLKLLPLFAALSYLKVLVSNDTGPTHLAAATDASIVLIRHADAPDEFLPLTKKITVIRSGNMDEIVVDEVFQTVRTLLKNDNQAAIC